MVLMFQVSRSQTQHRRFGLCNKVDQSQTGRSNLRKASFDRRDNILF